MQIKETRPGYVQLVENVYDKDRKRGVTRGIPGANFSILRGSVPSEIWENLTADDQAKLMAYIAKRLPEINAAGLSTEAAGITETLGKVAVGWPAIIENVGVDRAGSMLESIETAVKTLRKSANKAQKAALKAASEAEN